MLDPWKKSYDQSRQPIKKQRHYSTNKSPYSQSYGFSSSHVWMWELDYKESWAPKNWCFWTVVLEKTLESPLDCKRSSQSILKEISPEYSTDAEAETPNTLATWCKGPLTGKDSDAGKDCRQEEKGTTENEMVGWHHRLGVSLSKLRELMDRKAWRAAVHEVAKSWTRLSDWTELSKSVVPTETNS